METCHQESGEEGKLHRIGSPALAEDGGEVMAETGVVAEGEDGRLCYWWPVRLRQRQILEVSVYTHRRKFIPKDYTVVHQALNTSQPTEFNICSCGKPRWHTYLE
jgi:hypothetical protein